MKRLRLAISVMAAAALLPLTAAAATATSAAPPANDTPDGAKPVTLGDTIHEDTTQATTDKTDAKANRFCGAPHTNASVWFTYTPADDGGFVVDMSASDYSGGFMVFDTKPIGRDMVACGPTLVGVQGSAGTTYLIMAFSDTKTNGGNLVMSLDEAPPPPTVDVTIDPTGKVLPKGKAEISGTFACTDSEFLEMDGQLRQLWQRVKINGYFTKIVRGDMCDGKYHPWSRIVTSHNGTYAAGKATSRIFAYACGEFECTDFFVRRALTLTHSGTPQGGAAAPQFSQVTGHSTVSYAHWPTR